MEKRTFEHDGLSHTWLLVGGFIIVSGIAAAVGVTWYRNSVKARNERAYTAFVTQYEQFERLRNASAQDEKAWESAAKTFEQALEQHSQSSLAPYFRALYAEALMYGGRHEDAQQQLSQAVAGMKHVPLFMYVYQVQLAQMLLENASEDVRARGRSLMLELAQDDKNVLAGAAWFQLHHYACKTGDASLKELAEGKLKRYMRWQHLLHWQTGGE